MKTTRKSIFPARQAARRRRMILYLQKLLVYPLFLLSLSPCMAQQYNTWYFGIGAGISFDPCGPYVLTDGINTFREGNASISDGNGKILFYTNGKTIFNRTHQPMLNGDGLLGHTSAVQSSIIVPVPGNDSIYYVFTTDGSEHGLLNGYNYSVVNMKLDNGDGAVVTKNVLLNASCSERLTAARHANGIDVWVIGNEEHSNVFKAWLVTNTGLQTTPVVTVAGNMLINKNFGTMKVSPDGKQLCQTGYPGAATDNRFFQLFDFNNATGTLSNVRVIPTTNRDYFGCEFSPDSKLIYLTRSEGTTIDQLEAKLGSVADINASRITIPAARDFLALQTGPDGKIYLANKRNFLSVISRPNVKGIGCTLEIDKINLGNRSAMFGLPSAISPVPIDLCKNFIIHAPAGQTIEAGQSMQLFVTGAGTSFQWSPAQGLSDPNIQNPVATPMDNITYIVTATNCAGCQAVDSVAIQVKYDVGLHVPTGFTPGNDGRNDVFMPIIGLQYKLEEFSVYNRWGQKIFSTRELGKGWDGKLNGQMQNPGAYAWFLKVTDPLKKKIEKKGTVMLIR